MIFDCLQVMDLFKHLTKLFRLVMKLTVQVS